MLGARHLAALRFSAGRMPALPAAQTVPRDEDCRSFRLRSGMFHSHRASGALLPDVVFPFVGESSVRIRPQRREVLEQQRQFAVLVAEWRAREVLDGAV